MKIHQSGIDLIIMIKENVDGFTNNIGDKDYIIMINKIKYTLKHQPTREVYPECRMILEGVPRRYFNYTQLKQEIMHGFGRKIHNKMILEKLNEINHPCYGKFKKINEINPLICLSWDMVPPAETIKFDQTKMMVLKQKMHELVHEMVKIENIMAIQRERSDDKSVPSKVHVTIRGIPENYFHDNILINDTVVKVVYDVRFIAESVVLARIPQCYHCWGLGHFKDKCHRLKYVWCRRCGEKGHEQHQCQKQAHCALCGGNHRAYKTSCPGFKPLIKTYRTGKELIRNGTLLPKKIGQWTNDQIMNQCNVDKKKLMLEGNDDKNKNKNTNNNNDNQMDLDNDDEQKEIETTTNGNNTTTKTATAIITTPTSTTNDNKNDPPYIVGNKGALFPHPTDTVRGMVESSTYIEALKRNDKEENDDDDLDLTDVHTAGGDPNAMNSGFETVPTGPKHHSNHSSKSKKRGRHTLTAEGGGTVLQSSKKFKTNENENDNDTDNNTNISEIVSSGVNDELNAPTSTTTVDGAAQ